MNSSFYSAVSVCYIPFFLACSLLLCCVEISPFLTYSLTLNCAYENILLCALLLFSALLCARSYFSFPTRFPLLNSVLLRSVLTFSVLFFLVPDDVFAPNYIWKGSYNYRGRKQPMTLSITSFNSTTGRVNVSLSNGNMELLLSGMFFSG